jgi:large repetitive protein
MNAIGGLTRLAALVVVGVLPAVGAAAATLVVNSTLDAVDAAPGNGFCATAGGVCTLRAAVQEANALPGADVVQLPPGVFRLTRTGSGEDAAATGDLDVSEELEVDGAGADVTIVDGVGTDRIFDVAGGTPLTLAGLTIRNGDAGSGTGGGIFDHGGAPLHLRDVTVAGCRAYLGGGLYHGAGDLGVDGSTLENDESEADGGCAYVTFGGTLAIADSLFRSCRAGGALGGGAIFYAGHDSPSVDVADSTFDANVSAGAGGACALSAVGRLTVTGSRFTNNFASGSGGALDLVATLPRIAQSTFARNASLGSVGGAIRAYAGELLLVDLEIRDNIALAGGGVAAAGPGGSTIRFSRIVDNTALGSGGGVWLMPGAYGSIVNSTLSGNRALGGQGGGVYCGSGSFALLSSTLVGNQATGATSDGGGVFLSPDTHGGIVNATLADNRTDGEGGAVYSATRLQIGNATFVGNAASVAGGHLFNASTAGDLSVSNTILAGAVPGGGCGGATVGSDGNNIDDAGCGLAGRGDQHDVDPLLGPLRDNGGPTATFALLPGSPAIDAGYSFTGLETDQRGSERSTDGDKDGTAATDIGAYELVDLCPADRVEFVPGVCGCGVPEDDANGNGVEDCLVNAELKARLARVRALLDGLTGRRDASQTAIREALRALAGEIVAYVRREGTAIVAANPRAKLARLARRLKAKARRAARARRRTIVRARKTARAAADALDTSVAAQ